MNSPSSFDLFSAIGSRIPRLIKLGFTMGLAVLFSGSAAGAPYAFTTRAGDALVAGSTDGTGSAAHFNMPTGVVVDSSGTVYVVDHQYNHTIRKLTCGGVVTTLAGAAGSSGSTDGTGSAAQFNAPTGLAVDNLGNIYVADRENHTIRKITSGGEVTTLGGAAGTAGANGGIGIGAGFFYPFAVAVDSAGRLYVADTVSNTIRSGVAWTPATSDLDGDDRPTFCGRTRPRATGLCGR